MRRAAAAARDKKITALVPSNLKVVFATHLHSDHTAGLADLYLTPAVEGRPGPLELYGPPGIAEMARHIQAAYVKDVAVRVKGLENGNAKAYGINAHEIHPGIVYKDANVTVRAFAVAHGSWDFAYGYRFETADRSIVISGDTNPTQATIDACNGCDVLIHETTRSMPAQPSLATRSAVSKEFAEKYHTTPAQMADLARAAKPRLLLIYHVGTSAAADRLFDDLRSRYSGLFAIARDLDVF
jgi:ribonuclease Z